MANSFPARLHVLLASEAPLGVIFRRGPSKQVCSILWDRRKDTFEVGQWLKGRLYERRADLSPDGKHLIYFAMNGKWSDARTGGSWTAVSKAPYLKALALYGKGDCWHGGGLFTGDRSYWLNDGYGHKELELPQRLTRDRRWHPSIYFGGECPGVYYPRLQRDGWRYLGNQVQGQYANSSYFEKPLPRGWVLRKIANEQVSHPPGKGCYWDEHVLEHPGSGRSIAKPDWEWADMDGSKLVWAEKGCLYRGGLTKDGPQEGDLLNDFNSMVFRRIIAPY